MFTEITVNIQSFVVVEQWLKYPQKESTVDQETVLSSQNYYKRVSLLPGFFSMYNNCFGLILLTIFFYSRLSLWLYR